MARAHTRPRADQPEAVEPARAEPDAEPDAGPPHGGPRLPRVYVPRPRLWERLDRATACAVTLLVAPVGAGKTLGVGGWLQHSDAPQTTRAAWIHADGTWLPERLEAVLEAAAGTPDDEAAGPRLVVIDDAHALPAASVRLVDDRLNEAPERLRVLLISRWDLPLTRLLPELLGNLTVLRGDLLRMADAQCAALVAEHARTTDPEVVRAVTTHAQGWCAVVVLAARAVGAAPDPVAAAQRLAAGNTAIADRVASEVFAALSPRQRHLLLCVAGEGVVSAGYAVHLTHDPRAMETLVDLENTGLLVSRVPSDDSSEDPLSTRYRIHPLLVEVIRRRLVAGGVDVAQARATVVRAVHLDLARGVADGAFNRLVGVNAQEDAADLLVREGVRMALSRRGAPRFWSSCASTPTSSTHGRTRGSPWPWTAGCPTTSSGPGTGSTGSWSTAPASTRPRCPRRCARACGCGGPGWAWSRCTPPSATPSAWSSRRAASRRPTTAAPACCRSWSASSASRRTGWASWPRRRRASPSPSASPRPRDSRPWSCRRCPISRSPSSWPAASTRAPTSPPRP